MIPTHIHKILQAVEYIVYTNKHSRREDSIITDIIPIWIV